MILSWLSTHFDARDHGKIVGRAVLVVIVGVSLTIGGCVVTAKYAGAHEATNTAGQPLGIVYPPSCCNSAITSPFGDCAPIEDRYVTEREDGYHINLPAGAHPMLKRKGYIGVVPYEGAKRPISNDYHICLSEDGGARYCFFPKPGMM